MMRKKQWLQRLMITIVATFALCEGAFAIETTANSVDEFFEIFEENLTQQVASFSIVFTGDRDDLHLTEEASGPYFQKQMSARDEDGADNADFVAFNISEASTTQTDNLYTFDMKYLSTHEELAVVDEYVDTVIADFSLEGKSEFSKIKMIYEHVATNFTYDDTLSKYTPYDGLTTGSMVCQGYALLLSALLWEAEVPNRIVIGISRDENHAWNIVEMDGAWYNLDSTWDAVDETDGFMTWKYFLKNEADFLDHNSFFYYLTEDYRTNHPFAAESETLPQMKVLLKEGVPVQNMIIRKGVPVALEAVFPDGESLGTVIWDAYLEDGISITEDGILSADKPTKDKIQVSVQGNEGIIPVVLNVQSVDLTTASPWAFDVINQYYMAQMLPSDLCSAFQSGITRAEVARLAVELVDNTVDAGGFTVINEYLDIENHPQIYDILACQVWGIMAGDSKTEFAPERELSREEASVVLVHMTEFIIGELPQGPQTDLGDRDDIASWAAEAVDKAVYVGLLQGSDGLFQPQDKMTREEFMVAMNRLHLLYLETMVEEAA